MSRLKPLLFIMLPCGMDVVVLVVAAVVVMAVGYCSDPFICK